MYRGFSTNCTSYGSKSPYLKLTRFYIQGEEVDDARLQEVSSRKAYSLQGLLHLSGCVWPRFHRLPGRAGVPLVESVVELKRGPQGSDSFMASKAFTLRSLLTWVAPSLKL